MGLHKSSFVWYTVQNLYSYTSTVYVSLQPSGLWQAVWALVFLMAPEEATLFWLASFLDTCWAPELCSPTADADPA